VPQLCATWWGRAWSHMLRKGRRNTSHLTMPHGLEFRAIFPRLPPSVRSPHPLPIQNKCAVAVPDLRLAKTKVCGVVAEPWSRTALLPTCFEAQLGKPHSSAKASATFVCHGATLSRARMAYSVLSISRSPQGIQGNPRAKMTYQRLRRQHHTCDQ
jgi:hypothetical protein